MALAPGSRLLLPWWGEQVAAHNKLWEIPASGLPWNKPFVIKVCFCAGRGEACKQVLEQGGRKA